MMGMCRECDCAVLPGVGFKIFVENKTGEKEDEFLLCVPCFDAIMRELEERGTLKTTVRSWLLPLSEG